jgi:hypothetical protein
MEKLRITPLDKKGLEEVSLLDPLITGFRRIMRTGNQQVIVTIKGTPYILFVEKSSLGLDKWYARLLNEDGEIVAICDFDKFDL